MSQESERDKPNSGDLWEARVTPPPTVEFAFGATVEIGAVHDLGPGPLGQRLIVPIIGGSFEGPKIAGKVLPGGIDRQLLRLDRILQLHATYEFECTDGAVITVSNKVIIDQSAPAGTPFHSNIELTAPTGPHDWINRKVFVGTLDILRPLDGPNPAVCPRFYFLR